jgi:hypothetical protein
MRLLALLLVALAAFPAQMTAAKMLQQERINGWLTSGIPDRAVPDLRADLRPRINKLTGTFLEKLKEAQDELATCRGQERLKAASPGFSAEVWQAATDGLVPPVACLP